MVLYLWIAANRALLIALPLFVSDGAGVIGLYAVVCPELLTASVFAVVEIVDTGNAGETGTGS
jgi:hypothetical protein